MQLTKAGVMGFDKILNCDCNSEYIGTLLFVFASERYVGNVVNTSTDPPPQEVLLNVPPQQEGLHEQAAVQRWLV